MSQKELKEILENNIKIVEYYGIKNQIPVWIEEMSELTQLLCKWLRKYDSLEGNISANLYAHMYEEIADVTICLDQIKYTIHLIEDDLMKEYKWKVNRQLKRINEEQK